MLDLLVFEPNVSRSGNYSDGVYRRSIVGRVDCAEARQACRMGSRHVHMKHKPGSDSVHIK